MSIGKFSIDKSAFALDSLLNLTSVFLLGVSGIVLNIVIARFYTPGDLGVFNQIYAIYIFFSQLSVAGVQVSVLKHVAQFAENSMECDRIITAALLICVVSASVFLLILVFSRSLIGRILESEDVASGLVYILPGLWCFALNKVYLGILNGFEKMKSYALFSSMRALCMLCGLLGAVLIGLEGHKLCLVITVAECAVLVTIFFYTKRFFSFVVHRNCLDWIKIHSLFGVKSLSTGLIGELNTRVDILVLGIFTSDMVVGIYSLAAMVIEGALQLPFVLRRILDPMLTKLVYHVRVDEVKRLVHRGTSLTFFGMVFVFILLVAIFPFAVEKLTSNPQFSSSWLVFCILAAGAVVTSSYVPFSGLLVQGGYPGYQSLFILSVCLTNIALNFILIPFFGMYGAAVATTISYLFFVIYLKLFTYYLFKINI